MKREQFWLEFFQLYKELPALWRIKMPEYSDRPFKARCYSKLVRKLREIEPDADREMVVRKINNFRTSYRKELKKLKESQQAGRVHKPTLWYFNSLSFLHDQDDNAETKSVCEDDNTNELKGTMQDVAPMPKASQQSTTKRHVDARVSDNVEKHLPSTLKRKKIVQPVIKPIKMTYEEQKQAQMDADILAKSWAVQYNEMHGNQKLIARKIIADILFHGCIGTLNMSHTIDIQEILLLRESRAAPRLNLQQQSSNDSNSSMRFAEQEYFSYESPLQYNSSNIPFLATRNESSEFQENEIKFEVP